MTESDLVGGRVEKTLAACLRIQAGCKACRQKSRNIKVNKSHSAYCFGVSVQRQQGEALRVGLTFMRRYVREAGNRLEPTICEVVADEATQIALFDVGAAADADGGGAASGGESSSSTSAALTPAAASAIERTRSDLAAAAPNSSGHGRAVALVFNHPKIPLPVRQWRELFEAQSEQDRADVSNAMTEVCQDDDDEFVGEDGIVDHQAKGFAVAIASERPLCHQVPGSYMGESVTFTFHRHVGMAWAQWTGLTITIVYWPGGSPSAAERDGSTVYQFKCKSKSRIDVEDAIGEVDPANQPFCIGTPPAIVFLVSCDLTPQNKMCS